NPTTPMRIDVPAGTYNLTIAPNAAEGSSGDDGSHGNLVVTAPNLTIVGAGAGQTIIDASGLGHARALAVTDGAGLTLQGVTIRGGNEDGSNASNHLGMGGGVLGYNNSTLEIDDCAISDNIAQFGGGIAYGGGLTINRSTISYNSASLG